MDGHSIAAWWIKDKSKNSKLIGASPIPFSIATV